MTPAALEAIDHADALAGGKRIWRSFRRLAANDLCWGADIGALLSWDCRPSHGDKVIVVAISGDPLFYGIGTRARGAFWYRTGSHYPRIALYSILPCAQAGIDMNDMC